MDKELYEEQVMQAVHDCLVDESDTQHAVLITFNGNNGQVKTYAINAQYHIVQMLVTTAAHFCQDDTEERIIN